MKSIPKARDPWAILAAAWPERVAELLGSADDERVQIYGEAFAGIPPRVLEAAAWRVVKARELRRSDSIIGLLFEALADLAAERILPGFDDALEAIIRVSTDRSLRIVDDVLRRIVRDLGGLSTVSRLEPDGLRLALDAVLRAKRAGIVRRILAAPQGRPPAEVLELDQVDDEETVLLEAVSVQAEELAPEETEEERAKILERVKLARLGEIPTEEILG